jgi:flagella synthesis protein FlgN
VPAKETLEAFVAVLRREQDALATGDIDALAPLIAEKTALAEHVGRISASEATLLRDLAEEARGLNEANGKLIALRLQHNQKALNVLLAAAQSAATYGPDGQQQASLGGRILGSA